MHQDPNRCSIVANQVKPDFTEEDNQHTIDMEISSYIRLIHAKL